jgi:hypothetical protein
LNDKEFSCLSNRSLCDNFFAQFYVRTVDRIDNQTLEHVKYDEKKVKLKSKDGAFIIFGQKLEVEQLCSKKKEYRNTKIKEYENEAIQLDIDVKKYEFRILCINNFIKNHRERNVQIV